MHRLILTETFDRSYIFTMKVIIANRKAKNTQHHQQTVRIHWDHSFSSQLLLRHYIQNWKPQPLRDTRKEVKRSIKSCRVREPWMPLLCITSVHSVASPPKFVILVAVLPNSCLDTTFQSAPKLSDRLTPPSTFPLDHTLFDWKITHLIFSAQLLFQFIHIQVCLLVVCFTFKTH